MGGVKKRKERTMQKVMVEIDWYTKIILTLIVVLLAGLLARPYIEPRIARASSENIKVYFSSFSNSYKNPFYIQMK